MLTRSVVPFLCCAYLALPISSSCGAVELHVSPTGNDQSEGTAAAPLASLTAARDRLRQLRAESPNDQESATVWLHEGTYYLRETWELTEEDSGSPQAPVQWRALPNANVRLVGGVSLTDWRLIDDSKLRARLTEAAQSQVLVTDLTAQGITDYGQLAPCGGSERTEDHSIEFFENGQPLTLARWPNYGWLSASRGPASSDTQLQLSHVPVRTWQQPESAWVHGFLTNGWTDQRRPLATFDRAQHTITIAHERPNSESPESERSEGETAEGESSNGATTERNEYRPQFFVENVLEELDAPGEWYLDRQAGRLYWWPLSDTSSREVIASLVGTPLAIYGAQHVQLHGLTIEAARVCGLEIAGGSDVLIQNCVIRNTGAMGAHVFHGERHRLVSCEIYQTGEGGIRIEGGELETLTTSGHEVVDCNIHHFNRNVLSGRAGIQLYGVGHRVTRNKLHHGTAEAIRVQGNEHQISGNEIFAVCLDARDVGAVSLSYDWTQRGNEIRENYFHDIGPAHELDIVSVYLDDFTSGTTVTGNVFERAGRGVLIGGGRDNQVTDNLFVDCLAGVQVDARGTSWHASAITDPESHLWQRLAEVLYEGSPYVEKYPELLQLSEDEPALAKGNRIERNVFRCEITVDLHDGLTTQLVHLEKNWLRGDPQLIRTAQGTPQLAPDSPALRLGCVPINWAAIGRLTPSTREVLPVSAQISGR